MARIFWDTNLFIYLFEDNAVFANFVGQLRQRMLARGDQLLTSTLTVGEVLVGATKSAERGLAARYESFFRGSALAVIAFDLEAASRYAAIRQDQGISRPDAIQLACAAAARADLFITNDERLSKRIVPGLPFVSSLERAPI